MQINRLFQIIYLLLDTTHVTAKELAERFEVSTRTIYRDIETLSGAGIPVYMSKGKGGGIALLPGYILNKTVLTEKEKSDVLSALQALHVLSPMEDTTLQKLSSLLGTGNGDWIEVDFSNWANPKKEKELFYHIKHAILCKEVIAFTYANGKGEHSRRSVEPLKLVYKGNSWYLYGYCRGREDYRFFKLHRMKEIQLSGEHFVRAVPMEIWEEDSAFEKTIVQLRLKLTKQMAYRVYDEFDTYEQMEDGSFLVSLPYPKGEWLYQYVNSFGDQCEVLEPEEIRKEIRERLERTLKIYEEK